MYKVPFGRGSMSFDLPPGIKATVVQSQHVPPVADVGQAVRTALAKPVGCAPLRASAKPGDRVKIVVTDITRACPDHVLVPPLLEELSSAGVPDENVTIIVGIGAHRASTDAEKVSKLGADVVRRIKIIDPDPFDAEKLANLGTTAGGVPIIISKYVLDADLLIATGIVEPHQYAGYSGGRKTVAIGAGGAETIAFTHGPTFLDHPKTRLGNIEGNPFHEAVTEIAERVGLKFILNVVADDDNRVVAVRAGEPRAAFRELVAEAIKLFTSPVDQVFDFAIAGVGFPKDANLYQASRAASYLFYAPSPIVKRGGFFIVPAQCPEGAGEGKGEQQFLATIRDAATIQEILEHARAHGIAPGEQRAYVMASVLADNDVIVVGSECPDVVRQAKMIAAATIEEALSIVQARMGKNLEALIVPHALLTLPVLQK